MGRHADISEPEILPRIVRPGDAADPAARAATGRGIPLA